MRSITDLRTGSRIECFTAKTRIRIAATKGSRLEYELLTSLS